MIRIFAVLFLSLLSLQAEAQNRIPLTEADYFLQGQYGASMTSTLTVGNLEFAGGYRLLKKYPQIFMGVDFQSVPMPSVATTAKVNGKNVTTNNTDTITSFAALIYYHFQEENQGWIAGIKPGYYSRFQSTGIFVEPAIQYHYPLFDFLTVGIEAAYNLELGTGGGSYTTGSAVVQYWF